MAKAYETKATVSEMPTVCDHCGADALYSIGLVAPKCGQCDKFSMSHINFGPMQEIDVSIKIEEG